MRTHWTYELIDGEEVVYIGISDSRKEQAKRDREEGKQFTDFRIISIQMTDTGADKKETKLLEEYKSTHCGEVPKYNKYKEFTTCTLCNGSGKILKYPDLPKIKKRKKQG